MRQAHLTAARSIAFVEMPTPHPAAGEVVVRIRAALTCGTDLKTYRRGHPKLGFGPFGHEASGDVLAVGGGVDGFAPGDPVMWVQTAPCGRCERCTAGRPNLCVHLFEDIALGAYGDTLVLPARLVRQNLYHKPPQLSYIEAAFLEPLACVVHGWNVMRKTYGGRAPASATIVGAGTIGLLQMLVARHLGAGVAVVSRGADRAALAAELGASPVIDAADNAGLHRIAERAEAVIECAGTRQTWEQAVALARPGGVVLFFGGLPSGATVELDATRVHYGEIACLGAFHFTPADVREARELLVAGLAVRPLVTAVERLDDVAAVFERLDRREGYKYALVPEPQVPSWI